jgi:TonB family protein
VPEAVTQPDAQRVARIRATLEATSSGARRRTLIGRTDRDVVLVMYAETWRRKIELNTTIDLVREAMRKPHVDPLVTVALRSNGTVEAVTFNRSSGVAEIDEAVRRIVHSLAPYGAFPPDLAREYDVIEIRRTWTFDTAIRLF